MNPLKLHLNITAALMLLLTATVFLAYRDLGPLNTTVSLLISLSKALLVVLFFMRLRQSNGLNRLALAAGLFWLAILFALSLSDYLSRSA